jgi:EAL domain-containing protein (putative c-di-GMP-specific phosphodiesterase class I)
MDEQGAAPVRVLIVDDHAMLAESLVRLLAEDPAIDVIGTATTAAAGIAVAEAQEPDVVIMDYQLPDMTGAEATRLLLDRLPCTRVVSFTGSDRPGAYMATVDAGSSAWVRKTRAVQDLRAAVHAVHAGRDYADTELAALPPISQLAVFYQPIVELRTAAVVGFEALVRWVQPDRTVLAPARFLPLAEQTGYIADIGAHVLSTAAHQLAAWQRSFRGPTAPLWMSVNLSASGLNRAGTLELVAGVIDDAGIDPGDLVLEVTETVLIEDTDEPVQRLRALKRLGIRLALDDFGTAFSSLSYLRRFPFDHIKLDTTFTAELPDSPRSILLVEAVQQLASTMGLALVAEGIERQEQADVLLGTGCRLGQGFLYSRPVDPVACEAFLRRS